MFLPSSHRDFRHREVFSDQRDQNKCVSSQVEQCLIWKVHDKKRFIPPEIVCEIHY